MDQSPSHLPYRPRYGTPEPFAEGSRGRVWRARDAVLGRTVAVKDLKPQTADNPDVRARFLREARLTGQLEHPYIIPVYDLSADGDLYYTMRLVRGQTLEAALAGLGGKGGEPGRLLDALVLVCQAVAYAHSRGVVHRDLKPANILLGEFGEVFVLDWGLAKEVGTPDEAGDPLTGELPPDETAAGRVLGTPSYMAPEQAAGRSASVDGRTDVYALGAILFHIVTGQSPHASFRGLPPAEYLRSIVRGQLPCARAVRATVPAELDAVCARALATDPAGRYAGPLDLADDVRRWQRGEPTLVYREPWPRRLGRWAVGHRRATLAAATALVTAVVAVTALGATAWKDTEALSRLTLAELETRAQLLRSNLLVELTTIRNQGRAFARSSAVQDFLRGGEAPAARARLTNDCVALLEEQPYSRALLVVSLAPGGRALLGVGRERPGGPVRVLDDAALRSVPESAWHRAVSALLAEEPAANYLVHFPEEGSRQPAYVAVAAGEHWLVAEVDFLRRVGQALAPAESKNIQTIVRDEAGRLLVATGSGAAESPYAAHPFGGRVDPRLDAFFRESGPAPPEPVIDADHPPTVPPSDPRNLLALPRSRPAHDIVYALKIYYNAQQSGQYLGVILVAPYDAVLAAHVVGRDLLLGLTALVLAAVLAVVVLATYLAPGQTRGGASAGSGVSG